MKHLARLMHDESGSVAAEYGLVLTIISIIVLGTIVAMGGTVHGFFTSIYNGFTL